MNENDSAGQPGQNSPDGGSASQQRRRRRRRSRRRSSGGGQQSTGQTTQTAQDTQSRGVDKNEKNTEARDEGATRSRSRRRRKSGSQSPASGQQSGASGGQGQARRSRSKSGAKSGTKSGAKSGTRNTRGGKRSSQRHRRPEHGGPRMETRDETSAGGLVISGLAEAVRDNGEVDLSRIYVALIGRLDRRGRLLWSMPKGHVEPGEKRSSTAEREVWEETGVHGQVIEELGVIDYWFVSEGVRIHKTVHHYLLRFVDGELNDEDPEVTEVAWIPASELIEHLAYADERKLARIAHDRLPELARAEHEAGRATPR